MYSPVDHLHAASGLYPDAWRLIEQLRADRGRAGLPDWPAWCFLPMGGYYAIVSADSKIDRLPLRLISDVARLAAIGTWRYSQGIYRFDDDARAALADTLLQGEMPVEVLLRLPEWCVYIETPGMRWLDQPLAGFWSHLEWDANTQRRELRLLLLNTGSDLIAQILHIGSWTVTEAIDRFASEARHQASLAGLQHMLPTDPEGGIEQMSAAIQPLLALLLYLCSDEPEVVDREYPADRPQRPKPKKTKRGWRLFAPDRPRVWTVGEQLGEALRRDISNDQLTGRTVRPHLRRAHWHGFWTGPRDGERRFRYKWLPPTLVAAGGREDDA